MNKSTFFVIKVLLTVLSLGLSVVFKFACNWVVADDVMDFHAFFDIAYDLCIGVFSAMVIVWFVDEISERVRDNQSKEAEREAIVRSYKVLEHYINQYEAMFYTVVTPMSARNAKDINMPEAFSLSDMCDLHRTSLIMSKANGVSAVKAFFDIEIELRREFSRLVERYEFEYFKNVEKVLLEFISISVRFDCRSAILDYEDSRLGNRDMKDFIQESLKKDGQKIVNNYINGKPGPGNLFDNYVMLLILMQAERKCILKYKSEIASMSQVN